MCTKRKASLNKKQNKKKPLNKCMDSMLTCNVDNVRYKQKYLIIDYPVMKRISEVVFFQEESSRVCACEREVDVGLTKNKSWMLTSFNKLLQTLSTLNVVAEKS